MPTCCGKLFRCCVIRNEFLKSRPKICNRRVEAIADDFD